MVLGDMRIDVDDEIVVMAGGRLARRVRQHVARVSDEPVISPS